MRLEVLLSPGTFFLPTSRYSTGPLFYLNYSLAPVGLQICWNIDTSFCFLCLPSHHYYYNCDSHLWTRGGTGSRDLSLVNRSERQWGRYKSLTKHSLFYSECVQSILILIKVFFHSCLAFSKSFLSLPRHSHHISCIGTSSRATTLWAAPVS